MPVKRRTLVVFLLTVVLSACSGGTDHGTLQELVVRDSAGVAIVENPSGSEARAPIWVVDSIPIVRIGVVTGEAAYQFGDIAGVSQLSDGRIVVLEGFAMELRYFSPEGEHLFSAGGPGEGPEEIMPGGAARLFPLPDDTIAVWSQGRTTLFDATGSVVESITASTSIPLGLLSNRAVVVFQGQSVTSPPAPDGLARQGNHYLRVDLLNPQESDTLTFKLSRQTWGTRTVEIAPGMVVAASGLHVPFTHPPISHVTYGKFAITDGLRREIEVYDSDGRLERIVRIADEPEPLDPGRFRERTNQLLAELEPEDRAEQASIYASMPAPPTIPAYAPARVNTMNRLLLSDEGEIWIGRFDPDSDLSFFPNSNPAVWTAFNAQGIVVATVQMPPRFTPYETTPEGILGVYRDQYDVEYVQHVRVDRTP